MKKALIFLAVLCLAISIVGCGNTQTADNTATQQAATSETQVSATEAPKETNKGTVNGCI